MLSLSQRQSLQQRLSPQQVQYLKMLQLPVIALEQRIKQELEINPLLEELAEVTQENDQEFEPEQVSITERRTETSDEGGDGDDRHTDEPVREREFEWEDYVAGDNEGYKAPSFTGTENEDQDEFPQRSEESLSELLLTQLRMQLMGEDELALAEEIIGNIDDHGYLRRDLGEIVDDLNKFISSTRRTAIQAQNREQAQIGDGHFEPYEESVVEAPFGRDRLVAQILNDPDDDIASPKRNGDDMDDLPIDPFSVSYDDDDFPTPPARKPQTNGTLNGSRNGSTQSVAPAPSMATLSLEEMSHLSIEDLARLLEQGTSAFAPAGQSHDSVATMDGMVELERAANGTSEEVEIFFTLQEADRVLHRIQRLDPPGIGARDLRECLTVQLELEQDRSAAHKVALRMIQEAYTEFTMKHFEKICHKIGCSTEELKDAIDVIKTLNPKPGEGSSSMVEDNYLTPDFVIERDVDDFVIIPNDRHIPILRINRAYQELMRRGSGKKKEIDRDTRRFIRDKFEAAKWFIASIQQRRQTMMKVMRAIVDLQMDFFVHGPNFIRPMIYKDVAERIGMDISTVCRVVNGKYTQTDYGTFELRYFFSEKLETTSGEEVSTKIVKSRIQEMIDAEDKNKPLSDDAISKDMETAGFYVARRTVAKYREQLNIPVARLRRAL
ncbi:MAG: polymerase, sigma 54 subunit, RpoN [Chlorobi bacterium]|nr:polymerase, sigma 54 subunit, RpoN [Chlorobiota bacterium]